MRIYVTVTYTILRVHIYTICVRYVETPFQRRFGQYTVTPNENNDGNLYVTLYLHIWWTLRRLCTLY